MPSPSSLTPLPPNTLSSLPHLFFKTYFSLFPWPSLIPRPHPTRTCVYRFQYRNTESDPHWGWFWVWDWDYPWPPLCPPSLPSLLTAIHLCSFAPLLPPLTTFPFSLITQHLFSNMYSFLLPWPLTPPLLSSSSLQYSTQSTLTLLYSSFAPLLPPLTLPLLPSSWIHPLSYPTGSCLVWLSFLHWWCSLVSSSYPRALAGLSSTERAKKHDGC